jgi:hypothetical protein
LQLDATWVKQILLLNDNIDGIMPDNSVADIDQDEKPEAIGGILVTADESRFRAEEMTACPACTRINPPNRFSCLYCGAALNISEIRPDLTQINFQRPEPWEDGFSVIYAGKGNAANEIIGRAAEILRIETDALVNLATAGAPVPIGYFKSLPDAELLAARLTEIGLECAIAGDDLLTPQIPPTRIRSIEFFDEGIILEDFNTANKIAVGTGERVLFVAGSIFRIRSETTGKRSKKTVKVIEASESSSDETVLDIYPPSDVIGFRIRSGGFNFSCLGEQMRKIATENVRVLIDKLSEVFPNCVWINEYRAAYPFLDSVWPIEHKNESSEVTRGAFGGVRIERVNISDNTAQFTRFSRLQRHFI